MSYSDDVSLRRLNTLHPKVRDEATQIVKGLWSSGIRMRVTHTFRSWKEQQELYKRGRTAPGQIVTNAIPGRSFHNYGLALDFVLMDPSNKPSYRINDHWHKVVGAFKDAGWEWGGDFKSLKDYPHLQKRFGYTTTQLLKKWEANPVQYLEL